jgi:hypothetical protein
MMTGVTHGRSVPRKDIAGRRVWLARDARDEVSRDGFRPFAVPQSLPVPPAVVCPLLQALQTVHVCGSDRQLCGSEIRNESVTSGSIPGPHERQLTGSQIHTICLPGSCPWSKTHVAALRSHRWRLPRAAMGRKSTVSHKPPANRADRRTALQHHAKPTNGRFLAADSPPVRAQLGKPMWHQVRPRTVQGLGQAGIHFGVG